MGAFVPVQEVAARIQAIEDPVLRGKVQKALHLLHRTLELYRPSDISLSFNGGKDSTVLLHLMRVALHPELSTLAASSPGGAKSAGGSGSSTQQQQQQQQQPVVAQDNQGLGQLSAFYFEREDDFPEVRAFVKETDKLYNLRVRYLTHPDFKAGLEEYLDEAGSAAIVLGTRRGDPNAEGQEYFCPSSAGWPPFMRINPILDWSYVDVWGFLRAAGLPYCCLYDAGYTSLGGVHNTLPNSALKKADGTFAPAYILADGRLERAGRATQKRRSDSLPSGGAAGVKSSLSWLAGILVVGDEILSGKVEDSNIPFLCRKLHEIGWVVSRVVIVPDDVAAIAQQVAALSASCQAVITSGGVGPTLDDVTMEGIAAAFGVDVVRHPLLEASLAAYFGADTTPSHLKMADVPDEDTTRLISSSTASSSSAAATVHHRGSSHPQQQQPISPFPLVAVRNVFVLPGVPHLLQLKWPTVAAELQAAVQLAPFRNRVLRLHSEDEAAVAPLLQTMAAEWGGEIAIGSYPVTGQRDGARLLVTLESKQAERLDSAVHRFQQLLQPGSVITVQQDVSSLSGQSGKAGSRCSSGLPSPQRGSSERVAAAAAAGAASSSRLSLEQRPPVPAPHAAAAQHHSSVKQQQQQQGGEPPCVVTQAAAVVAGLSLGSTSDDGSGGGAADGTPPSTKTLAQPLLSD